MCDNILKYWYVMEFLEPCWPVNEKEDIDLNQSIPWQYRRNNSNSNSNYCYYYDVYIGRVEANDMMSWLLEIHNTDCDDDIEPDSSASCLCALKVDECGFYVPNSFSISSFVWAISYFVYSKDLQVELDAQKQWGIENEINQTLICENNRLPLAKENLYDIFLSVCEKLRLKKGITLTTLYAKRKRHKVKRDSSGNIITNLPKYTELMHSFYAKDIDRIRKNTTSKLDTYIESKTEYNNVQKSVIDSDAKQIKYWLAPQRYPLGMWPSEYRPSLMQQVGINIATSEELDIFSINGPPGTGKTTLLKEIVVSNIVKRALIMSKYIKAGGSGLDAAFEKQEFKYPNEEKYKHYYTFKDDSITKYGIMVASNNNAAVENISVELPKSIKRDRSGHFNSVYINQLSQEELMQDTYFADLACELLQEEAWGLISVKLGKRENIKDLTNKLWKKNNSKNSKNCLSNYFYAPYKPNIETAYKNFLKAWDAVVNERKKIEEHTNLLVQYKNISKLLKDEYNKKDHLIREIAAIQKESDELTENAALLTQQMNVLKQNYTDLKNSLSPVKRIFRRLYKKNSVVKELNIAEQLLQENILKITNVKDYIFELTSKFQALQKELEQTESTIAQKQCDLVIFKDDIEHIKAIYDSGKNWADTDFWRNIENNENSQIACPWTYQKYDMLREELFYYSLMLNKACILSSNCVKQNLSILFDIWDSKADISKADLNEAYGSLLNTFMLVVPVVSTTFASVQSFLGNVGINELGTLIIDEAGQATPQSALGALWRSKQAIIVGDPMQVEPVTSIPKELRRQFVNQYNVPRNYYIPELSVQTFADNINPYGGIREFNGQEVWVGCPLLVHRRCKNPMFNISNKIAYNNTMFNKTGAEKNNLTVLLKTSVWIDVKGNEVGNKDHTVDEQILCAKKLFERALDIYNGLPNIYFITPFKLVAASLRNMMRSVMKEKKIANTNSWIENHCGTVHTFQGKEASEVILVLGCDINSGYRAAEWVGKKPNIVNVAVSRAKNRIAVIGDYDLWNTISNVHTICEYLKVQDINEIIS